MPKLTVKKIGSKWWIVGLSDYGPMGPWDSDCAAEETRVRLLRFYRHKDEPGYVTIETKKDEPNKRKENDIPN